MTLRPEEPFKDDFEGLHELEEYPVKEVYKRIHKGYDTTALKCTTLCYTTHIKAAAQTTLVVKVHWANNIDITQRPRTGDFIF
ncbi:hypothetical protein EOD39_17016 [Acipenser ruthenus]|uniref:Uncharacterized protein n=1 Tax=Acipenser ruthenus TaxID=7906 RepID=A0A444V4I3_ACIRT|nr:hypothetical protein EOD39_17016 [Acipenser ruthenus]